VQWSALVREQRVDVDLPLQDVQVPPEGLRVAPLFVAAGLAASNSEATRKLGERALRVDGELVEDRERVFAPGSQHLLQLGKRAFARVRLVTG
jgi:tyrosyl-tRNA synthetase